MLLCGLIAFGGSKASLIKADAANVGYSDYVFMNGKGWDGTPSNKKYKKC